MPPVTSKATFFCTKCKKVMQADNFYNSNNLTKYPEGKMDICKRCLTLHVDNWEPDTYIGILQEIDVPYLPNEWHKLLETYGQKSNLTGMTILGKYLSKMKLKQFKDYRYKDTEFLQELEDAKIRDALKRQGYEAAEIAVAIQESKDASRDVPRPVGVASDPGQYDFMTAAAEEDLDIDLTDEDKLYLKLKWGKMYRPDEWVKLEQFYNDMMASYDVQGAGHEDTLKLICKTSLKANQLIDMGDKH